MTDQFYNFSYDENTALLRRHIHAHHKLHVSPVMRAKLNRALTQIIRNRALEGKSELEPQVKELLSNEEKNGEKKSYDPGEEELAQKQGSGDS